MLTSSLISLCIGPIVASSTTFSIHNRKVETEEREARKTSVIIVGLEEGDNENVIEPVKKLFRMRLDIR